MGAAVVASPTPDASGSPASERHAGIGTTGVGCEPTEDGSCSAKRPSAGADGRMHGRVPDAVLLPPTERSGTSARGGGVFRRPNNPGRAIVVDTPVTVFGEKSRRVRSRFSVNRPQRDGSKKGTRRAPLQSLFLRPVSRSRGSSHLGRSGHGMQQNVVAVEPSRATVPVGAPAPVVTPHVPDQVLWEG